ncbi:MAG TPA: DUF3089 domain-containing protein [Candidatus Monoglobus merdigallinarum]|uniref:DUF3089 domain-containing protein n=1 Tax=Candidatus Monoglobus merdigallinarum TaxID=2838698 RepID=A0A9D1PRA6_9FIRM|nr:DUF3089 domain-containing protein [Candidatus Monoglobus merdigallinarum]
MKYYTKRVLCVLLILALAAALCSCGSASLDYADNGNWAYAGGSDVKDADLFIICPTVDLGDENRFNMSLDDTKTKESFVGALNMELGIYNGSCNVYAPFYRQMTLNGYGSENEEEYINIAYEDVKNAFCYYIENLSGGRPFVLAGFSQGSQLALMLMKDLFDEPEYSEKLIAAYLIGWRVTDSDLSEAPWLKMAEGEGDTGCIISFSSEAENITSSFIVPEGTKTYAINPLNWKTDSTPASASENKGACFTNYSGEIKQEIPGLTGAYIDPERGTLKVTDVSPEEYPPSLSLFGEGEYHVYDYQFFYRNLQENVGLRVKNYIENIEN